MNVTHSKIMKQLGCDDDSSVDVTKIEYTSEESDEDDDETLSYDESDEDLSVLSVDEDLRESFKNGTSDSYSQPFMSRVRNWYAQRKKEIKLMKDKNIKSTVYTAKSLQDEARKMIREQSPNCCPIEKLAQLEYQERLHLAFEKGDLSRCILSFYLDHYTKKRRKLLHHMGSHMSEDDWDDPLTPMPPLPIGLTMIPKGWKVLADKGFVGTSRMYPNMNEVSTPIRPTGRKESGGRYHSAEVKGNRGKCKLRYTCEVVFARVTLEEILRDVIPYQHLSVLPHAHAWAHGYVNLLAPLRPPGNSNYFEN
jgi:hypothetical protein